MAWDRTSCQIAALGEREVLAGAELRAITVSIHPPEHRIELLLQRNQMGSRYWRRRTAAARHTTAKISPIHRPGLPRNLPGVIWVIGMKWGSMKEPSGILKAKALGANPKKRSRNNNPKCAVWKAMSSTRAMARGGNTAHRNVVRLAQAEISSNHA